MEFQLFLPQMRMDIDTVVARARAAEAAGFSGIALMDHLAPPLAEEQPMYEAMVSATWIGAHTTTLHVGHLVLCDALRHPAVLAKQAVTLDHATKGRFELGLGWGSWVDEFHAFGLGSTEPSDRFDRLVETIDVLRALWTGARVTHDGAYHRVVDGMQRPVPSRALPLVIGGAGPRTMRLVSHQAETGGPVWWNCPTYAFHRFDELRDRAGSARPSLQQMIALVPDGARRDEVRSLVARRFGADRPDIAIGTAGELVEIFQGHGRRGVERIYAWFTDFAAESTLEAFGRDVISALP